VSAAGASQAAEYSREGWTPMLEVATREVFELMLGCQLSAVETATPEIMDMTAMVGLAGQLCGVMSIRCNRKSAGIMASKMLGVEPNKVGPEMCDAFGEICNMVAGNFKNKIPGLGDGCMLSVPTVITGEDYSVHSPKNASALEISLLFENLPVIISLKVDS